MAPDGPLYLHGDIEITTPDDDLLADAARQAEDNDRKTVQPRDT